MWELLRRIAYVLHRRRVEAELAEEIEFHRAMKERELQRSGAAPENIGLGARRALGNDLLARERSRDVWIPPWLSDITQDCRFACRLLLKQRGFTLVAVLALGLGIGVNTTMFSILNAFCIRGLPIDDVDRVVFVASRDRANRDGAISYPDFVDLQSSSRRVTYLTAYTVAPASVRDEDRAADRCLAAYMSWQGFRALGEAPVLGRDFRSEDDKEGAPPVVVLGATVWRTRYGSNDGVLGRTIVVNGIPSTVIGVMRDRFGFPHNTELWLPLSQLPGLTAQKRDARRLAVVGRLVDGATVIEARADLETIGQRLATTHHATNDGIRVTTVPIEERFIQRLTHPAWLAFMTAGVLVVLIACANVANLLLSRAVARSREVAVRASLGATRNRVVRQLLVESSLLALLGGLLGLGVAFVGLQLWERAIPAAMFTYWLHFSLDARVFAVLALVCLGTVLVSGLVPALHVSKTDATAILRDGGRGSTSGVRARRWTAVFLTAEFALTMILLSGVGGTVSGFFQQQRIDRVFDPSPLLTMMVSLPPQKYARAAQRTAFFETLSERLAGIERIASFATATSLPLAGASARDMQIDGRPPAADRAVLTVRTLAVDDSYFRTMRLHLALGRPFERLDGLSGREAVIVNERLVSLHFRDENPIGKRIRLTGAMPGEPTTPWLTIVGVSPTVRQRPQLEPDPIAYLPLRFEPPATAAFIVRASSDPLALAPRIREEVQAIDRDLPIYRILSMEDAISESSWNGRASAWMISIIAAICVWLSLVGLYAVTAHSVAQRTLEVGVRLALGARPNEIRRLVLGRASKQIAVGIATGIVCTFAWGKVFATSDSWTDPTSVFALAMVLALVALIACLVPAGRAARLDPVIALRAE